LQEFNGTTLDEAVALMNRQNLAQIIINDPAVGRLRVDGYFRSDNPEGFVRIVAESFGLKAEEQDGHSIRLHARP
jgi:transmembrane sensor